MTEKKIKDSFKMEAHKQNSEREQSMKENKSPTKLLRNRTSSPSEEVNSSDSDELELLNLPRFTSSDELPIFNIRSMSPSGCSLSPIDSTVNDSFSLRNLNISPISDNSKTWDMNNSRDDSLILREIHRKEERITLAEINEQINTPPSASRNRRLLNLETIFEDVFLETPPKRTDSWRIDVCKRLAYKSIIKSQIESPNPSSSTTSKSLGVKPLESSEEYEEKCLDSLESLRINDDN